VTGAVCDIMVVMSRPLDQAPVVTDWQWLEVCWYAYSEVPGFTGSGDRETRVQRTPTAILDDPHAVAAWIEAQYAAYAPHTQASNGQVELDVERAEIANYRRHTNAVLAARGQSVYVQVTNVGAGELRRDTPVVRSLYVEAVTGTEHPAVSR
jgi:hypothetical protein